jgi:Lrp/AsnC family leucine-responsive transcriptional regulator
MTYDELDNTDRKILRILQSDSTLTVKELAARVNLSASPAFDRQKRLEREGFIKGYHAILDAKKAGNGITVLCNMRLKHHSQVLMDDFMEAIQSIEEITECYNTSGEYDFTLKIQTRDMESYQLQVSRYKKSQSKTKKLWDYMILLLNYPFKHSCRIIVR